MTPPAPDYGIDAPRAVGVLFLVSAAAAALGVLLFVYRPAFLPDIPWYLAFWFTAADCLGVAFGMLWYSRFGKMRQRDRLLSLVPWCGDETVLDVGCGRGLLLVGVAERLKTGRVVGIDIWSQIDMRDNRPEVTLENARRAGVADRIEVRDGDAQKLPFPDASFDVIVSSLVLHNIPSAAGREQAVREIARVLKPGGRVAVLDLRHTRMYVDVLRQCGLSDARREIAGWLFTPLFTLFTWGAVQFYRVSGTKPLSSQNNSPV